MKLGNSGCQVIVVNLDMARSSPAVRTFMPCQRALKAPRYIAPSWCLRGISASCTRQLDDFSTVRRRQLITFTASCSCRRCSFRMQRTFRQALAVPGERPRPPPRDFFI
ncbi:MAG TPA: hypothetical protein VKS21_05795 [Spirochaetota bacterium]|nr:hypothetical protein [Spirochaetota bacterium]